MKRSEKIIAATKNVNAIKSTYELIKSQHELIKKKYDTALFELKIAEASFDIGEKVKVVSTCGRGCCTEYAFKGEIVSKTDNGSYNVKTTEYLLSGKCNPTTIGIIMEYIYSGNMERL